MQDIKDNLKELDRMRSEYGAELYGIELKISQLQASIQDLIKTRGPLLRKISAIKEMLGDDPWDIITNTDAKPKE